MLHISDRVLDDWLSEDLPYLDLTSWALDIDTQAARFEVYARAPTVVCGASVAARIFKKLEATPEFAATDGKLVAKDELIFSGSGNASALHAAWKLVVNVLEYASGVATRTKTLVDAAHAINPDVAIVSTRKSFPGTRALSVQAVLAGGGSPHRLGLSETVLVFDRHRAFFTEDPKILPQTLVAKLRKKVPEKKLLAEVGTSDEARLWAQAGIDGIQFDKFDPAILTSTVRELRVDYPDVLLIGTGGIDPTNIASYASSGVNVLSTSTVYHGKPADLAVKLFPVSAGTSLTQKS